MAEFRSCLERVISSLNQVNLNYVIVGGLAAIIHGRSRTTMDIDLIVEDKREIILIFVSLLEKANFDVSKHQILDALDKGYNISIFDNLSYIRLDIKPAKSTDEKEVLENAIKEEYHDMILKIASNEQILYGKLMYIGNIDDLSDEELVRFNDVLDFCVIYDKYKDSINLTWLRKKAEQLSLLNTLERLIAISK